ncbi:hypothetical protein GCM10011608_45690 [Micromonospora sonchi]|uniref:Uncharacterized protein n=1 Tax=Micromonospora sonchi TaxID=1763543 RepID=A0A917X2A4_9ACTN|nr:hypothetical protein GCM10011608_45690 [Micromonospora sonchi]
MEQWHRTTRKAITKQYLIAEGIPSTSDDARLVHSPCQRDAAGTVGPSRAHRRAPTSGGGA